MSPPACSPGEPGLPAPPLRALRRRPATPRLVPARPPQCHTPVILEPQCGDRIHSASPFLTSSPRLLSSSPRRRGSLSRIFTYIISIKSFVSCSQPEICKLHVSGNKANAHACIGANQCIAMSMPRFCLGLWCIVPFMGRGSCVYRVTALASLRLVNVSTHAFFYCIKSVD